MTTAEHARLKDHVASMTGGLEAKVYEGGKELPLPPTPPPPTRQMQDRNADTPSRVQSQPGAEANGVVSPRTPHADEHSCAG